MKEKDQRSIQQIYHSGSSHSPLETKNKGQEMKDLRMVLKKTTYQIGKEGQDHQKIANNTSYGEVFNKKMSSIEAGPK